MEQLLNFIPNSPIVKFTILLLVILTIPPVFERIKLPGLVGLLFAGVILGQNGFKIFSHDSETMKLFADIGKVYLMFVAGLEIDLKEFRQTKNRSLTFGLSTFAVPLITGTLVGNFFGYGWNSAILIGSLLASHTLLGYPIVNRLGVVRNQAVTITIGATIFTDIAALLVLAICLSIHRGEFSPLSLIIQLASLGIYVVTVLFGLDRVGKEYFRRTGDEESNQFLFVLLGVFLTAVVAQIINVDQIVGAFLAGLAVNDLLGSGPVKEKVEFVGSTLFIPLFFVSMGLLLDVPTFIETVTNPTTFQLMLAIVGGLILSKLIAAVIPATLYRYRYDEVLTMWSLSLPQVAATLAAALAAFEAVNSQGKRLIDAPVFNIIIVLMLVTSILGPLITSKFARNLVVPKAKIEPKLEDWTGGEADKDLDFFSERRHPFNVVVPIYNPYTQRYLIEMAALLARHESGTIVPLSIAKAHVHMDDPSLHDALKKSQKLLKQAQVISQELAVAMKPKIRIDDDIAKAISRTAREENASLVVMGWSTTTGLKARLFGTIIDSVFWSSHCPVAVMRLLEEPVNIHRILVPIKIITPDAVRTIQFAHLLADANQASITLLHVCVRKTSLTQIATFEEELSRVISEMQPNVNFDVKTVMEDTDVASVIIRTAQNYDLLVIRSMRRRTVAGLAVSDVTHEVLNEVKTSLVLFGEPHS